MKRCGNLWYSSFGIVHTDDMEQDYHIIRDGTKLIGITFVVFAFMKWALPVVLPFFVAYYVANLMKKDKGEKRWPPLAVTLVTLGILAFIALLCFYLFREFQELWDRRDELLQWKGASDSGLVGQLYTKLIDRFSVEEITDQLVDHLTSPFGGISGTVGGFVAVAVTVVAAFLMVKDYDRLQDFLRKNTIGHVIVSLAKDLSVAGGDYLKAQGQIMLIETAICVVSLWIVGNPYALLVGIVIGICDALPFIGTSLIFLPWAAIMFFQRRFVLGLYYLFLAGLTSLLRQFLEPKLIGQRVGANPLIVLISIYLGLQIYGIWGVLLGPASAFLIWEIYRFT